MKTPKRIISVLLALVLCLSLLPMSALAAERSAVIQSENEGDPEPTVIDSGTCGEDGDNVIWTLTSDGVLTFSGVGKIYYKGYNQNGDYGNGLWRKNHAQVKKVVVESGVTSLCSGFCYADSQILFANLEEVEIAGTVSTLGSSAFCGCTALKTVTLHKGLLKSIGYAAFEGCTSLEKIEIPKSVTKIEESAFKGCSSLEQVSVLGNLTSVGRYAFSRCASLKEIVLPGTIKIFKASTFYNCTSLERVVIPDTITKIDANAFCNCTALKEVCYLGTPEQWAKIDIYPVGNFNLRRAASYNLPLCKISTKYANYSYTGSEVKPVVTVRTLNDVKLKKGTNYTVSYENNEDYGTATITITGIGKYSGTTTRTFQIRPGKVQNLRMDRKTTYADLYWKANPEATSYRIYKSGVLLSETRYTCYRLNGLTSKTNCTVTVKAVVKRTNPETGEPETFLGLASSVKVKPMQ